MFQVYVYLYNSLRQWVAWANRGQACFRGILFSTKKCVIFQSKPVHNIDITIVRYRTSYLYNGIYHTTPYEHVLSFFLSFLVLFIIIFIALLSSDVFGLRYEANKWQRNDNTMMCVFASREYWIQRHRSMVVIMQYTHTTCICTLGQNRLFIVHCAGKFVFRY